MLPGERLIILPCLPHTREMNFPAMPRNPGSLLTILLFACFISLTLVLVRKTYHFNLFWQTFKMEGNQEKRNISIEQPTLRSRVSVLGNFHSSSLDSFMVKWDVLLPWLSSQQR